MIIAIDGPAGSGKSTISREVAARLGLRYLDTGAMYRAVTLLALEAGLVPDRIAEAGPLAADMSITLQGRPDDLSRVFVDGREVTEQVRGPLVTTHVSAVSADAGVRAVLTDMQRAEAAKGDVVLEGRDMGTVVCPGADLKVFLTASVAERARRRQLQLAAKGIDQTLEELAADIERRDAYDSSRALAPLRKAEDAVEIDTTGLSIEQVIAAILAEAAATHGRAKASSSSSGDCAKTQQHPARWPLSRLLRSPHDTLLWRFAYSFLPPLWKAFFRMDISGREHIPPKGPVLLASNHRSNLDPFFLGSAMDRQVHFMAKVELWKVGALGRILDALGAFPVSRGEADRQAVRQALELLDAGAVVGLFPEGHRQRAGGFGQINPGVALFSLRKGVVTVPVVLEGTERVVRGGIPRPIRIKVTFGPPLEIPPSEWSKAERAQAIGQQITQRFKDLDSSGSPGRTRP